MAHGAVCKHTNSVFRFRCRFRGWNCACALQRRWCFTSARLLRLAHCARHARALLLVLLALVLRRALMVLHRARAVVRLFPGARWLIRFCRSPATRCACAAAPSARRPRLAPNCSRFPRQGVRPGPRRYNFVTDFLAIRRVSLSFIEPLSGTALPSRARVGLGVSRA